MADEDLTPEEQRQEKTLRKARLQNSISRETARIKDDGLVAELDTVKSQVGGFQMTGKTAQIGGTIALDKLYGRSEPGGIHQILGVSSPASAVDTNLFTVLGNHTARVSVLWVANRRLIDVKVRVGFDVAGDGTNIVPDEAWLYYNVKVPAESTLVLDAATGLWLGAADDVVVRTDVSGVSFGVSGSQYATV